MTHRTGSRSWSAGRRGSARRCARALPRTHGCDRGRWPDLAPGAGRGRRLRRRLDEDAVAALFDGVVAAHGRRRRGGQQRRTSHARGRRRPRRRRVPPGRRRLPDRRRSSCIKHAGQRARRRRLDRLAHLAQRPAARRRAGGVLLGEGGAGDAHRGRRARAGARGIRVNAVSPGPGRHPADRAGDGHRRASRTTTSRTPRSAGPGRRRRSPRRCVFCSGAAWLTGEVLDLNGGAHLMRYPDLLGHVTRAFG